MLINALVRRQRALEHRGPIMCIRHLLGKGYGHIASRGHIMPPQSTHTVLGSYPVCRRVHSWGLTSLGVWSLSDSLQTKTLLDMAVFPLKVY